LNHPAGRYTRDADQRRLAESAMHMLEITNAAVTLPLPSRRRQ